MAKRINSKSKGNRAELKIAHLFSETFNEKFSRTPNSGAFGSTHSKSLSKEADTLLAGDFITPVNFVWCMENKCGYNQIELMKFFTDGSNNAKNTMFAFLKQSVDDAIRVDLIPMVIYNKNYCNPVAVFPLESHDKTNELKNALDQIETKFYFSYQVEKWEKWVLVDLSEILNMEKRNCFLRKVKVFSRIYFVWATKWRTNKFLMQRTNWNGHSMPSQI